MTRVPERSHLIPTRKTIHGKTKTFQAIRYISPEERKKRVKEFLGVRKKSSQYSRYMEKNPLDITILYPNELSKELPVAKNGEQYYHGHPDFSNAKRVSVNIKDIVRVIEFKEPVKGCAAMIRTNRPSWVRQYLNEKIEKQRKVKFKRVKNVGKNLESFRERYAKLQNSKSTDKKELGVVLQLIDQYQMRIGGSRGGIVESKIKDTELKPGMVITHTDWKEKPQLVVKDKIKGGLTLRNMETGEDHAMPEKYKEFIRLGHYGASTLEARHVKVEGKNVTIDIIGKSGKWQKFLIKEPKLSRHITELAQDRQPGDRLFPGVKRSSVTRVLDRYKIHPHDFRSYHATKAFVEEQANYSTPSTKKELKQIEKEILTKVSNKLWNTPGMAKSAYVEPTIYEAWRAGVLEKLNKKVKKSLLVISEPLKTLKNEVAIFSLGEALNKMIQSDLRPACRSSYEAVGQ